MFPETYPFLGRNPRTGGWAVHRLADFRIDFLVSDIRDLDFGPEFDIVLSVGLIEHFPDEHKPLVLEWHRKFLKPGGYAVLTTPRRQWRSRAFYLAMGEIMNFRYRELFRVVSERGRGPLLRTLRAAHSPTHRNDDPSRQRPP